MPRLALLLAAPATVVAAAAQGDIEVGLELQLWRPHSVHAPYALRAVDGVYAQREVGYGYEPAFALTGAYRLAPDGAVVARLWLADADDDDSAPGEHQAITGGGGTGVDGPVRAEGEFTAWTVDLGYRHDTDLAGWAFSPGIGLRWLDLSTRQDAFYEDAPSDLFATDETDVQAIGPRLSLGASRGFAAGWRGFAEASYALLLADWELRDHITQGAADVSYGRGGDRTVTTIEARFGVAWRAWRDLDLQASWTIGTWRDVLAGDRSFQVPVSSPEDLTWDAFALGASWTFGG